MPRHGRFALALGLCALGFLGPAPARPAGFAGPPPGIKAMGMAGAFTAQANDPTAAYFNPGGMALLKKGKLTAGFAGLVLNESQYQGLSPGVGIGTTGEQEQLVSWPAHAYFVQPLSPMLKLGIGVSSPYAFRNEWAGSTSFPGRFVSEASELQTWDASTSIGLVLTQSLGLGVGAVYRSSKLTHSRHIAGLDPETGQRISIADLDAETDFNDGFGWHAGLLHRIGKKFAWGIAYRSPIEIDYTGAGRLTLVPTGNAQLDELTRATLPLDQDLPIATTISFPDTATLGLALFPSETSAIELDVERHGWSEQQGVAVLFPINPQFSRSVQGAYEDAFAYRLGLRFGLGKGIQVRLGYAFEETPQPDESVGPFLPDANRSVFSLGIGRDWLDIGVQLVAPENRITRTNADDLNGAYSGNSWMLGISVTK